MTQDRMAPVHPFNLTPQEYDTMYHGPLPDCFGVVLFANDEINAEHLWEDIHLSGIFDEPEDDEGNKDSSDATTGGSSHEKVAFLNPRSVGLNCNVKLTLKDHLRSRRFSTGWGLKSFLATDPWDLQVAFQLGTNLSSAIPIDAMQVSMDLFDHLVTQTGSLEAGDHPVIQVADETATAFQILVGDVYRSGWGYLNRQLIEYRNKVLIAAGAILLCRDPVVEYRRFVEAGGWYYLQYPELCP